MVGRPDKFLLLLREVSREARDAFRPHPEPPFCHVDVFENVGYGELRLLALGRFVSVGGKTGDIDEAGNPVIGSCGRNHTSAIRVADEDGCAADPPKRPFYRCDISFGCVEAVLGGNHFVSIRQ